MKPIVPFISTLPKRQIKHWIKALSKKMPKEKIVNFSEVKKSEYKNIKLAIVANPKPEDVNKLDNLVWIQSIWAGVERLVSRFNDDQIKIVRLIDPEMSRTMSEAVLSWVLYLHRDVPFYKAQQNKSIWKENIYIKPSHKTVGFLGLGQLGKSSALKILNNGFNVCGWSRTKKNIKKIKCFAGEQGLKKMLKMTDILVCLIPLTKRTKYLLNYKKLSYLKKGASIINFARGPIIKTIDLVKHLNSGNIKHAVLDVFEKEPLPKEHVLWKHPRVTLLPHISANTDYETATLIVANNIKNYRRFGKIPKFINSSKGY